MYITMQIKFKEEQKMRYNGKEIEVTCTVKNGTPEITIFNDELKLPFTFTNNVNAAVFLASVYGGTKEEALIALNNFLLEVAFMELNNCLQDTNNNEKDQEDRCIEISTKDFFSMSMEEFDTYVRTEFLKKGIDIDYLSQLPDEKEKERYIQQQLSKKKTVK